MNPFKSIINRLKERYNRSNDRSKLIVKNVMGNAAYKIVYYALSYLIVPIALGYLTKAQYGIWLTMTSIFNWITNFDIGLGNGLRNRFAKARAADDDHLAGVYVSTTYYLVTLVMGGAFLLFCAINPFLNWISILNAPDDLASEMRIIPWFVCFSVCLNFVLGLLKTVYTGDQRPVKASQVGVITYASTAAGLLLLNHYTHSSLLYYALVYSFVPSLVLIIAGFISYNTTYKAVRPKIALIQSKYKHDLLGFGLWFFFLSITCIILFSSSNLILSHELGPEAVVPYNLIMKYFQIGTMVFYLVLAPFWSAVTDAYYRNDLEWISRTMRHLHRIFAYFCLLMLVMIALVKPMFHLWVGDKVEVSLLLSGAICLYQCSLMLSGIYMHFLNGVGKIRVQIYYNIWACVLFLGASFFMIRQMHWGAVSVSLGLCAVTIPGIFIYRRQYNKIISGTATGIWNK